MCAFRWPIYSKALALDLAALAASGAKLEDDAKAGTVRRALLLALGPRLAPVEEVHASEPRAFHVDIWLRKAEGAVRGRDEDPLNSGQVV